MTELLSLLDSGGNPDCTLKEHEDLFGFSDETHALQRQVVQADIDIITGLYSSPGMEVSTLPDSARRFYELSVNAFDAFVHAWMSEQPIETEMLVFGRRVIAAADRRAAEKTAADRGEPDTLTVLTAASRVQHEIHRMLGLLRFFPDEKGVYIARCGPDHFVLPALGEHFTVRFGETAWAVFDEKRGLCLRRFPGGRAKIHAQNGFFSGGGDEWEDLWRHYHKTINNEERNNPDLQRRLMPKRYWKYLPEM